MPFLKKLSSLPNHYRTNRWNTGITGKNIESLEKLEYLRNLNLMAPIFEEVL